MQQRNPASCGSRLLLVAGDAEARTAIAREVAGGGVAGIEAAASGGEALDRVEQRRFDMLLIDLPLADIGGCELCRNLRQRSFAAPIIMLSHSQAESDAIDGLEAGADDFVVKPYHLGLLLARLRAHLRQHERSEEAVLEIGSHRLDCARRVLTENRTGRRIRLTAKEAALLRYLYRNRGRPVRPGVIMQELWGYRGDVETHTAETHIYRLRQKLEPDPARPRLLVRGAGGYQLSLAGG